MVEDFINWIQMESRRANFEEAERRLKEVAEKRPKEEAERRRKEETERRLKKEAERRPKKEAERRRKVEEAEEDFLATSALDEGVIQPEPIVQRKSGTSHDSAIRGVRTAVCDSKFEQNNHLDVPVLTQIDYRHYLLDSLKSKAKDVVKKSKPIVLVKDLMVSPFQPQYLS
jgi:actin-related protein